MSDIHRAKWSTVLLAASLAACGGSVEGSVSVSAGATASTASTGGETGGQAPAAATDAAPAPVLAPEPPPPEYDPNPAARHLIAVGEPSSRDGTVDADHARIVREHMLATLRADPRTEVLHPRHGREELVRRANTRSLPGLFLECSLVGHSVDARGTHAAVQLVVVDVRNEDVLGTLQGRATAPGPGSDDASELAFEGAIDSALRGLPPLLARVH